MPFSTSFCITNTGNLLPGTSVNFFSNLDDYTTPFRTNILLSDITSPNCPYVLSNIPDGTTTIQLLDVNSSCCVTVPVSTFTCDDCDFGFDVYSSVTFNSRIVAGNLTASCDNNITDYVIEWFNVNDLTTPLYVSGLGDEFENILPWVFEHPLTGIASIPAQSGTYRPVIRYIRLNGINYSSDLENGLVQIPLEECLSNTTVSVNPLNCDNGNITGDYTHLLAFSGSSQGQPPSLLSATFILSPDTNYFAWRFTPFNVPDTLRITYFGENYDTGLVLEFWNVGIDNTSSNLFVEPKVVKTGNFATSEFNKVTCLTGITRSVNDFLVIDIIPNQINPKTDFELRFVCLENYNCDTCYDNYLNDGYKIIGNSITATTLDCDIIQIGYNISGCTWEDLINSDYVKYTYTPGSFDNVLVVNNLPLVSIPPPPNRFFQNNFNFFVNGCTGGNSFASTRCNQTTPNNDFITFNKDNSGVNGIGNVYMEFSNPQDLNAFLTTYNERLNELGGIQTDPTTVEFYSYILLRVPYFPNMNPVDVFNDPCGDGTVFRDDYYFHTSSIVTTGQTGDNFFMNLTMPTITDEIDFTVCELGCEALTDTIIYQINFSSTGTSNNQSWVNGRGNRIDKPFYSWARVNSFTGGSNPGTNIFQQLINTPLLNTTTPMSGNSNTLIPSLSSTTCNLVGERLQGASGFFFSRWLFFFRTELTNPNNINDFRILALDIVNGQTVGNFFTIYEVQDGVVIYSDPDYII